MQGYKMRLFKIKFVTLQVILFILLITNILHYNYDT